jgi:hypothetical protein
MGFASVPANRIDPIAMETMSPGPPPNIFSCVTTTDGWNATLTPHGASKLAASNLICRRFDLHQSALLGLP